MKFGLIEVPVDAYRIRANKPPLLIKPPSTQNSNKPPPFCQKVHFFGLFWANFGKIAINLHLKALCFIIDRWWFIASDTVQGTPIT